MEKGSDKSRFYPKFRPGDRVVFLNSEDAQVVGIVAGVSQDVDNPARFVYAIRLAELVMERLEEDKIEHLERVMETVTRQINQLIREFRDTLSTRIPHIPSDNLSLGMLAGCAEEWGKNGQEIYRIASKLSELVLLRSAVLKK